MPCRFFYIEISTPLPPPPTFFSIYGIGNKKNLLRLILMYLKIKGVRGEITQNFALDIAIKKELLNFNLDARNLSIE